MKIATIIIRVLYAVLLLLGSIPYFWPIFPQPELTGDMRALHEGLMAARYLMPFIKAVELLCGIALLVNRFIPLATVLIFPIVLNIFFAHVFLAPKGIPVGAFMLGATLFLAYRNKACYRALFTVR